MSVHASLLLVRLVEMLTKMLVNQHGLFCEAGWPLAVFKKPERASKPQHASNQQCLVTRSSYKFLQHSQKSEVHDG